MFMFMYTPSDLTVIRGNLFDFADSVKQKQPADT